MNKGGTRRRPKGLPPSLALFALVMFATQGHAHNTGHGNPILEKGPNGGALTAVVLAQEADLGKNAKTQAVAEWIRRGDLLEIRLWDPLRKTQVNIMGPAQVKWIVLGDKLRKPQVIQSKIEATQFKLAQSFETSVLEQKKSIEVILPNVGSKQEKHVTLVSLKEMGK